MDKRSKSSCETSRELVRSLSRVPSWQAQVLALIALLGAAAFVAGTFWYASLLWATSPSVEPSVILMIGGGVSIAMLVPLSFIIYLAKETMSLRSRLDEVEKGSQQAAPGNADSLHADEREPD